MIGSGIFIVDADIARGTNSPALFLGAWVVTAILTMTARAQLRRAGGHDAQGRRAVRLPARVAGAAVGLSLRLDALSGHPDGHHRRCRGGLRQVSRRLLSRRLDDPLAVAHRPRSRAPAWAHGAGQYGDRRQHGQPDRHCCRHLPGHREHLRREAGRADSERLYHGQGAVAWRR